MQENIIKANNLSKSFGDLSVLKDINLEIKDNEVVAIIGPSGTGKSTFFTYAELSGRTYFRSYYRWWCNRGSR